MSKALFAAAKELIEEKRYTEARAVLKTIDHPTAREWEVRLALLDPIDERDSTLKFWKRFVSFFGIVAFLLLSAVALTRLFPELTPEGKYQATFVALSTAVIKTQTAMPTRTPRPTATATPTLSQTERVYMMQTRDFYPNQDKTRMAWVMVTAASNRATDEAFTYTSIPQTLKAIHTEMAAMTLTPEALTPLAPAIYYALDENYLRRCPNTRMCPDYNHVKRGGKVNVIGIVDGMANNLNHTKWYKIQFTDISGIEIAYQYVEFFSPKPPAEDEHSILIPTPTPTPTPMPTPTRRS